MGPTDAPDPHVLSAGTAPTPFTAAQIQAGCPSGRTVVFAVTGTDGVVRHRMSRFAACDEAGALYERGACSAEGEPVGALEGQRFSWLELQGHASFPAVAVAIDHDTIDLPVGRLDCLRYAVGDGADVTTFWFANALPGMPVKVVSTTAGRVEETTEMVANLLP